MESREQRIATLAATLKGSGIAKSDSQARMMAEEMIGVEEHVQKNYEEKHARANEYLQNEKNLGNPRRIAVLETKLEPSRKIEPIAVQNRPQEVFQKIAPIKNISNENVQTDVDFGGKTLSQAMDSHDTHNAALEEIKNQMSKEKITPLEDMEQPVLQTQKLVEPQVKEIEPVVAPVHESSKIEQQPQQATSETAKLDAQKLIDMMEEDGKLEEHTREIKEKPKDVKPKEAYAENSIDLSNMFNFGKR